MSKKIGRYSQHEGSGTEQKYLCNSFMEYNPNKVPFLYLAPLSHPGGKTIVKKRYRNRVCESQITSDTSNMRFTWFSCQPAEEMKFYLFYGHPLVIISLGNIIWGICGKVEYFSIL